MKTKGRRVSKNIRDKNTTFVQAVHDWAEARRSEPKYVADPDSVFEKSKAGFDDALAREKDRIAAKKYLSYKGPRLKPISPKRYGPRS